MAHTVMVRTGWFALLLALVMLTGAAKADDTCYVSVDQAGEDYAVTCEGDAAGGSAIAAIFAARRLVIHGPCTRPDCDAWIAAKVGTAGAPEAEASVAEAEAAKGNSIVILLDASRSMRRQKRMVDAKTAARRLFTGMKGVNEVALLVFYDCERVVLEHGFTTESAPLIEALDRVEPLGDTPLAASILKARAYLETDASNPPGRQRIVLLTDGEDTCGGDPIAAARQ